MLTYLLGVDTVTLSPLLLRISQTANNHPSPPLPLFKNSQTDTDGLVLPLWLSLSRSFSHASLSLCPLPLLSPLTPPRPLPGADKW